MNFLPRERDNIMTLQEAIAFIHPSGDLNRNSATFAPFDEIDELLGSMMEYSPEEEDISQSPAKKKRSAKKKKRARSLTSPSTVLQRRRRANILSLREQATKLQEVLHEFLRGDAKSAILKLNAILKLDEKTCADSKVQGPTLSQWHRSAVEQFEMRTTSEKKNRQLKKILSQQKHGTNSFRRILRRQSLVQDIEYMKKESRTRLGESLADNYICRSISYLENVVENMYQDSTLQFDVGSTPSLSSPVQTSYREQREGEVVEFIITIPMACSMTDASNEILSYLKKDRTPGSKSNALQLIGSLLLHHLDETLQFEKLHYIRKFSEPEKVPFVCSDIVLLPSKGLKFCSTGYTTIKPLPADPLHTCVVRSVIMLRVDNEAGQQDVFGKDVALGALSKIIRLFWQSQ